MSQITQKGATGALALQAGGSFATSTDANLATLVGTRYDLSDGREVILVSNGSTAIASSGVLLQDAAIVSNHQNLTVSSFTAYSNNGNIPASVLVTLGATKADANQYQGGFAIVNSGAGIGQTLRIASHGGAASSGTIAVTLEDAPNVALTTSSKVCLLPPHGANVILYPTTPTGAAVGVTLYPVAAGIAAGATTGTASFAFAVSKGVVSALSDTSAPSVGGQITASTAVAGAIGNSVGTGATLVGYANQTAVSAESRSVFVNL